MLVKVTGPTRTTIDGKEYECKQSIEIRDDSVIIDGKAVEDKTAGQTNVEVHGNVYILNNRSGNVTAQDVGEVNTGSGSVSCKNVDGDVSTGSGDVHCEYIAGSVKTGSGKVNLA